MSFHNRHLLLLHQELRSATDNYVLICVQAAQNPYIPKTLWVCGFIGNVHL